MYLFYKYLFNSTEYNLKVIDDIQTIEDQRKLFVRMLRKHIGGVDV
jgi:hypothetical protein